MFCAQLDSVNLLTTNQTIIFVQKLRFWCMPKNLVMWFKNSVAQLEMCLLADLEVRSLNPGADNLIEK
jgi:hypothetical protein